jgi:hypothetical protein
MSGQVVISNNKSQASVIYSDKKHSTSLDFMLGSNDVVSGSGSSLVRDHNGRYLFIGADMKFSPAEKWKTPSNYKNIIVSSPSAFYSYNKKTGELTEAPNGVFNVYSKTYLPREIMFNSPDEKSESPLQNIYYWDNGNVHLTNIDVSSSMTRASSNHLRLIDVNMSKSVDKVTYLDFMKATKTEEDKDKSSSNVLLAIGLVILFLLFLWYLIKK